MANIYVRQSGNDSNDGSTPALAKLTIAGAISAMNSGDIIYVGSGIYREFNLTTGAKTVTILGDITGEHTGDAGEVIWSGMNSDDTAFETTATGAIDSNTDNYGLTIRNIIFENWNITDNLIKKWTYGVFDIQDVKIRNVCFLGSGDWRLISFYSGTLSAITLKNIDISGINVLCYSSSSTHSSYLSVISIQNNANNANISAENIKIHDISFGATGFISSSNYGSVDFKGFYIGLFDYSSTVCDIKNVDIYNIFCSSNVTNFTGVYVADTTSSSNVKISNSRINNIILGSYSNTNCYGFYLSTTSPSTRTVSNCSISGILKSSSITFTNYYNLTQSNNTTKIGYSIPQIEESSKHSPLKGLGNTTFPTMDIDGNPRPAYGNGTACDIGASESTSDTVQKESTVKDSGDYSMKVAPCNYFKRIFQIPVTASELRTVKAKIRIDGTWGTYLPKITLSGQGMTLSSDTKNATTGIALLTVEAHSPNTDAIMYLDTITLS